MVIGQRVAGKPFHFSKTYIGYFSACENTRTTVGGRREISRISSDFIVAMRTDVQYNAGQTSGISPGAARDRDLVL